MTTRRHASKGASEEAAASTEESDNPVQRAAGALRGAAQNLDLRGKVERHPYGMVAAALGVGYLLGGGLFSPLTMRLIRLGARLATLPQVKDSLVAMAESMVDRAGSGTPN